MSNQPSNIEDKEVAHAQWCEVTPLHSVTVCPFADEIGGDCYSDLTTLDGDPIVNASPRLLAAWHNLIQREDNNTP